MSSKNGFPREQASSTTHLPNCVRGVPAKEQRAPLAARDSNGRTKKIRPPTRSSRTAKVSRGSAQQRILVKPKPKHPLKRRNPRAVRPQADKIGERGD